MLTPSSRAFGVTWVAYAGYYLCRKNFSVVMALLAAQGMSKGDLANAVFAYSLAYSLGQFTAGGLVDRFGSRRVVTFGMLLSVVATASIGWAGAVWAIVALQAVNGAAQATGWPGLLKLIGGWFGREQRGVVMGWWTTNYVAGGFAATLFATWASGFGWQWGLWAPAALLACVAVVFFTAAVERKSASDAPFRAELVMEVLRNPRIQVIAATYAVIKLTRYSFLFWLPLYMTEQLGYSAAQAGYSSAMFEIAGFAGTIGAGYLSDRVFGARRFPAAALMLAMLAIGCLLHPALSAYSVAGNLVAIAIIGFSVFGPDTLLGGAATQDAAPPEAVATAGGTVNGVGSIGQLISPWLVVLAVERYGWANLFYGFAVLATMAALLLTLMRIEREEVLAT